jgi:hypothetical protein
MYTDEVFICNHVLLSNEHFYVSKCKMSDD